MTTMIVLQVVAALLVLAGIVGSVLPALPGVPLVFGGLLLSAWADGFNHVGAVTLNGQPLNRAFIRCGASPTVRARAAAAFLSLRLMTIPQVLSGAGHLRYSQK